MLLSYFDRIVESLRDDYRKEDFGVEVEVTGVDFIVDKTSKHPCIDVSHELSEDIEASISFDPYNQEFYYWATIETEMSSETKAKIILNDYEEIEQHISYRLM
jgi:hypothetical protein